MGPASARSSTVTLTASLTTTARLRCALTAKATAATATPSTLWRTARRFPTSCSSTSGASATTKVHDRCKAMVAPSPLFPRSQLQLLRTAPRFATATRTSVCSGRTSASATTRTTKQDGATTRTSPIAPCDDDGTLDDDGTASLCSNGQGNCGNRNAVYCVGACASGEECAEGDECYGR